MTRIKRLVKSARGVWEPALSEDDVVGQIRNLLELNGFKVFRVVERIPWGRTYSTPGIPDLIFWIGKNHLNTYALPKPIIGFIEVKRPGGKLRDSQERWIAQAQEDGVMAFKAESWEECVEALANYGIPLRIAE